MAPGFAQTLENQLRNEHGAEPAVGQLERIESSTMSDGLSVTLCVMDASACGGGGRRAIEASLS